MSLMHRVFASTGAFIGRPNGRDFHRIAELAPKICCDGFELMFYEDWYGREGEICRFLGSLGLDFPTFHCEKKIGELLAQERFDEAFELPRREGARLKAYGPSPLERNHLGF